MTRFPRPLAIGIEAFAWTISIATVFWAARYLFQINSSAIFWGWDPLSMKAFIGERYRFSDIIFGLGSDPVRGMGNIAYPLNPRWFPSYALTHDASGNIHDGPLAFAIAATELFAATALCGRMNGFSLAISLAAGWLITATVFQLFGMPVILTIFFFFPHHAELVSVAVLMGSIALRLGDGSSVQIVALTAALFLCLSFILFGEPTSLVLALPAVGLFTASTLLLASSWRKRLKIALCWASLAFACLILGYLHYVAGLLLYTAAAEFPDISRRVHTLYRGEVSLLLWTPISELSWSQIFTPERIYVGGGFVGSIIMFWLGSPLQRRLALGVFSAEVVFITIGLSNYFYDYWIGPAVSYFEVYLFPYFALCFCFLLIFPILVTWRALEISRWASPELQHVLSGVANATASVLLALAASLGAGRLGETLKSNHAATDVFVREASPLPQPETPITHLLKEEIKLAPGQPFRGRVAVMTGRIFPEERAWERYSLVHYFSQFATGNLHDGPGLWQDDIPTLLEYNTLISPPHFVFLRTFLTEPTDTLVRNIIGTRRIDQRILKAIGVRFIITDQPIADAVLRTHVTIPTPRPAREYWGFAKMTIESFELYLYELADVNIGQFSPTEVRLSNDANQILTQISDQDLRLDHVLVASEALPEQLRKAELVSFSVERDAFTVRAKSEGHSVLLLPWEFSRCLKITSRSGTARLFRADLLLTGLLFAGELDATITFHTAPLIDSRCRLKDLEDNRQLKIKNAFDDRPALSQMRPQ